MHGGARGGKSLTVHPVARELTTATRGRSYGPMAIAPARSRATLILFGALAAFVIVLVFLVGSSLVKRSAAVFDPTPVGVQRPPSSSRVDTLTVDARDDRHWAFVDLARGIVLTVPEISAWDLAFRRHDIGTTGAIADLGEVRFEEVRDTLASTYIAASGGRDTVNAAIRRWYVYGMMSHLLQPNEHVYIVRTRAGHYIKLQILSYYCRGLEGGCLTFRYAAIPPS